jgi:hypothetical protein
MTYEYKLGILILKSLLILEQGDNEETGLQLRGVPEASKNTQRSFQEYSAVIYVQIRSELAHR